MHLLSDSVLLPHTDEMYRLNCDTPSLAARHLGPPSSAAGRAVRVVFVWRGERDLGLRVEGWKGARGAYFGMMCGLLKSVL